MSDKERRTPRERLDAFLADNCETTKAKYAAELANAESGEWVKPLDFCYAESLVFFGLLERRIETLYAGRHVRGSRAWFKKVPECTPTVSIQGQVQTTLEFA